MAAFRYIALTDSGATTKGVIEAESARHARALIRQQGLAPVEVDAIAQTADSGSSVLRKQRGRLRTTALALLTRQLATLLSAGLPLERALSALIEQAENDYQRDILAAVRTDVLAGSSLATALNAQERDFPEIYRALVAAGEQSGDLAKVLDRLATYLEDRASLAQQVLTAFIYPALLTLVAVLVVILMLTYVLPQVVAVFDQSKQKLPLVTVLVMAASDFLRHWWWLLLALLAGGWWSYRRALRSDVVRLRHDAAWLNLPILGRLQLSLDTARFASTLAILVGGGVPILKALEAGAATISNRALRRDVDAAAVRVREGAPLARALSVPAENSSVNKHVRGRFPPVLVHLIASGESTGNLPDMLQRAARIQTEELQRRTLTLTSLLQPVVVLVMGAAVLVIVLAMLLPIIEINTLVK
ncbi:MAG: type II secretion system inner membrane protein GspF [Burkholderiales bacterium]